MRAEHNRVCTAHNRTVIWAKLERNVAVIGKIGGLVANLASKAWGFLSSYTTINLKCRC